jgi:hypothetical protein
MKLSTRLVLLVVGCLVPILTAQVCSQINLYAKQREQLGGLALRQAEVANADMVSIIDSVHQLAFLAGQTPSVLTPGEHCEQGLTAIRQSFTQYRFLAIYAAADGSLLCASDDAPERLAQTHSAWVASLLTTPDLAVGQLMTDPATKSRFLPIAARTKGVESGAQSYVLIAALDTDWLIQHLETATVDHQTAHASLIIADREGNVIGRAPDAAAAAGRQVPDWIRPLLSRQSSNVETFTDAEGHAIVAAYVPSTVPPVGLTIIDAVVLPDLIADIDQASYQNLLVIGAAALVALVLAWVAGRRFIYRPRRC